MNQYRKDFPLLATKMNHKPLVYFDFAATTPKPTTVITAIAKYLQEKTGNPGRSTHTLAFNANVAIECVRTKFLEFLHATTSHRVIFAKNATEAINLVAHSLAVTYRGQGVKPTIITTEAEHHANLLPWINLQSNEGFDLMVISVKKDGAIDIPALLAEMRKYKGAFLAVTHYSNVTGSITELKQLIATAKENDITILLDATQSAAHAPIHLQDTPVDYLVVSAHKMYGPEGIGALVVSNTAFSSLQPLILGGGMVETVTTSNYIAKTDEGKFEAGTPNTAGIIGFGHSLDYLSSIGIDTIQQAEKKLSEYFLNKAKMVQQLHLLGRTDLNNRSPIFSFTLSSIHPHDVAEFMDQQGIAVRAGYHCAEPLHKALNSPGSVRVSLSFLNTTEEIDYFFAILSECLLKYD